mmetsp:Transcript_34299/g.83026  ORF Transcript_34299/g.83026 Transcript_34299/m.83026 type:complete len:275 (-) Transcript_34299:35-859(-)
MAYELLIGFVKGLFNKRLNQTFFVFRPDELLKGILLKLDICQSLNKSLSPGLSSQGENKYGGPAHVEFLLGDHVVHLRTSPIKPPGHVVSPRVLAAPHVHDHVIRAELGKGFVVHHDSSDTPDAPGPHDAALQKMAVVMEMMDALRVLHDLAPALLKLPINVGAFLQRNTGKLVEFQGSIVLKDPPVKVQLEELGAVGDQGPNAQGDEPGLEHVSLLVVEAHDLASDGYLRLVIPVDWGPGLEDSVQIPEADLALWVREESGEHRAVGRGLGGW